MKKEGKIIDFRVAKLRKDLNSNSELDRRIAEILSDGPRTAAVTAPKPYAQANGIAVLSDILNRMIADGDNVDKLFIMWTTADDKTPVHARYGMSPVELMLQLSALDLTR